MADRHSTHWRRRALVAASVVLLSACSGSDTVVVSSTTLPAPAADDEVFTDAASDGSGSSDTADASAEPGDEPVINGDGEPIEGAQDLGALGETPVRIDDGDESIEIGIGDLPEALTGGFPLPDDFTVDVRSEVGETLGVTGTSPLSVPEATAFYESALASEGYEIVDSTIVPDVFATFEFDGPTGPGQVAVSETPGSDASTIIITVD